MSGERGGYQVLGDPSLKRLAPNSQQTLGRDFFGITVDSKSDTCVHYRKLKYEDGAFVPKTDFPYFDCSKRYDVLWTRLLNDTSLLVYHNSRNSLPPQYFFHLITFDDTGHIGVKYVWSGQDSIVGQWGSTVISTPLAHWREVKWEFLDFRFDPPASHMVRQLPDNFIFPGYIDGYLYQDPALDGRKILLDTSRSLIFAFSNGVMDIYRYTRTTYGQRPISAIRRPGPASVRRVRSCCLREAAPWTCASTRFQGRLSARGSALKAQDSWNCPQASLPEFTIWPGDRGRRPDITSLWWAERLEYLR